MNKLTNKELKKLESVFTKIQRDIENGINTLFSSPPIRVAKVWKRDQGGGGHRQEIGKQERKQWRRQEHQQQQHETRV